MHIFEIAGRQIATSSLIKRVGRKWSVPSQTSPALGYLVDVEAETCTVVEEVAPKVLRAVRAL